MRRPRVVFIPTQRQPEKWLVRRLGWRRAGHRVTIAVLVETCKLNDVDPLAYLADILTRISNGHPNSDIDRLLP